MSEFDEFCDAVNRAAGGFAAKGLPLEVIRDSDAEIVKVYGRNAAALSRARSSIGDVEEFSSVVAEHHPYWNALYQCAQIATILLENWDDAIPEDDKSQVAWSAAELQNAIRRIAGE